MSHRFGNSGSIYMSDFRSDNYKNMHKFKYFKTSVKHKHMYELASTHMYTHTLFFFIEEIVIAFFISYHLI